MLYLELNETCYMLHVSNIYSGISINFTICQILCLFEIITEHLDMNDNITMIFLLSEEIYDFKFTDSCLK
jgi:hypothetical protein